jgi:hypothetical protein
MKHNGKFNYGEYIIEYRVTKTEPISFLKKIIKDIDSALREADTLKNKGYHDVLIRTNKQ